MTETFKTALVLVGGRCVLWALIALSVASVAVMLDRLRVFWSLRDDFAALVRAVHFTLGQGDVEGARKRLAASPSVEAAVGLAGVGHWQSGATAAQEAMAAAMGLQRARLEKRLLFLGTVGNNAPFVGLLGTVIGIVGAFDQLGASTAGALGPERVMGTIAEALVATALGLLVAIPAVAVFNWLESKLATAIANADTLGHLILSHMNSSTKEA